MLSQLLCLQVVEKQGHFALFAQTWAVHGGWGARATRAQAGGKETRGIGGAQLGQCGGMEGDGRVRVGGVGERLTHRLEESPKLLWAELPSCSTVAQKRLITSSTWGCWCTVSGCWVSQYLRVV